jgi:hypothetical protein
MSNCGCSPSGYPKTNNDCCANVAEYTRFAYSSAQSAFANAENAKQSAEDAATTLANAVLKTGSTMTGLLELSGDPVVPLGAATKQYVDSNDALKVSKAGDTMTGLLVLSADPSAALGAATKQYVDNTRVAKAGDTMTGTLTVTADILANSSTSQIGYGIGAGGTINQLTNKSTAVNLDRPSGQITMNNAALGAGIIVSFTLNNATIDDGDVLVLNHISGGTAGAYTLNAQSSAGSATINVRNATAGSLSEAIVIAFAVIKAQTS